MRMRPLSLSLSLPIAFAALALAATAGTAAPPAAAPAGDPVFVLTGAGYGHGVGMSQWGAYAQARAGRSASDILSFYYPDTEPGRVPPTSVRALLRPAAASVTITSPEPFSVRDAIGQSHPVADGSLTLDRTLTLPVDGVPTPLDGPVVVKPRAGGLLSLDGKPYRGSLELAATAKGVRVVDVVGLEAYLQGVVPGEMPHTWPAAALEAQAIAARSYALASRVEGRAWDLYPGARSQQYLGAAAETPETTAAVRATAGSVLLYGGTVATTLYSSSSGGETASGQEAFALDAPYLPAQPDPWDSVSPYHAWKPRAFTGAALAKALGLDAPVVDVQARLAPSTRVASLVVTAADGTSLGITGAEARRRLGLRSTDFRLATLRFLTPAVATSAGVPLRLAGVARDAQAATLERLAPNGTWALVVRRLVVSPAGTFATVVRPTQTTTYRLLASGLPGPSLTIPVLGA